MVAMWPSSSWLVVGVVLVTVALSAAAEESNARIRLVAVSALAATSSALPAAGTIDFLTPTARKVMAFPVSSLFLSLLSFSSSSSSSLFFLSSSMTREYSQVLTSTPSMPTTTSPGRMTPKLRAWLVVVLVGVELFTNRTTRQPSILVCVAAVAGLPLPLLPLLLTGDVTVVIGSSFIPSGPGANWTVYSFS